MDFLFKSSILVLVLLVFYQFILQKELYFKSIRYYFLTGLIIIIVMPLIEIPIYVETIAASINTIDYSKVSINNAPEASTINWQQLFITIYIIGVVFLSVKFLTQIISLIYLISRNTLTKQGAYYFIETSKETSPFSFLNVIIYNKNQFSEEELLHIINHEKAHASQWHSIDTILTHLLVICLWFNPFVWLYKKAVQQNLEFLADKFALECAENKRQYQVTLLKTCTTNFCTEITNNFYNSLIKKRIIMLQKNQNRKKSPWKFTLLVPILIAFIATFNTKIVAQEKKLTDIENVDKLELKFQFNKDSKDETLKKQAAFFKKQFNADLSFKGIKRNTNNEIIAIKITSKYKSNSTVFKRKSDEPISPIIITYNSENDKINIGDAIAEAEENIHQFIHKKNLKKNKEKKNAWILNKEKDTIIVNGNKINWYKNEDNNLEVEVIETDKNKKNYKVKSAVFISDEDEITEIDADKINASENVYIIKSSEKGEKDKIIITKSEISFPSNKEQPIYILNEKEITAEEMEEIDPNTIQSVNVFKDKSALNKYGEKGKNGVIEITTKNNYSTSINVDENDISSNLTRIVNDDKPMILVNGKEVSAEEMKRIDIETIKSMNVIKNEMATKKYGEKGKNGVIVIKLKE